MPISIIIVPWLGPEANRRTRERLGHILERLSRRSTPLRSITSTRCCRSMALGGPHPRRFQILSSVIVTSSAIRSGRSLRSFPFAKTGTSRYSAIARGAESPKMSAHICMGAISSTSLQRERYGSDIYAKSLTPFAAMDLLLTELKLRVSYHMSDHSQVWNGTCKLQEWIPKRLIKLLTVVLGNDAQFTE